MYTEPYRQRVEITGMHFTIDNARSGEPQPYEALQEAEEPTPFARLLSSAATADELRVARLMEEMFDDAWRLATTRALRGELRRRCQERGMSKQRYFAAFHGLAMGRATT